MVFVSIKNNLSMGLFVPFLICHDINPHHPRSQGSFFLPFKKICEGFKKQHIHITVSLDTQKIHHKVLG